MAFNFVNITQGDPTTTIVKQGQGVLHSIILNTPVATGLIKIYDGIQGSEAIEGDLIATILIPASPLCQTLIYDLAFSKGLLIVTSVIDQNITVTFR